LKGKRIAVAGVGIAALVVVLTVLFWSRKAGCTRMLETAELTPSSEVQKDAFGGCRIVKRSAPDVVPSVPDQVSSAHDAIPPAPTENPRIVSVRPREPSTPIPPDITLEQIEAEKSAELSRCLSTPDAAAGNSNVMGSCVSAELEGQDVRLNTVYHQVIRRLDSVGRASLRSEERAWTRRRDARCVEEMTGGTGDMFEWPNCLLSETIRRRLALETMLRR
jgi:uncharacterized protein YecT (DUF1311 family)